MLEGGGEERTTENRIYLVGQVSQEDVGDLEGSADGDDGGQAEEEEDPGLEGRRMTGN